MVNRSVVSGLPLVLGGIEGPADSLGRQFVISIMYNEKKTWDKFCIVNQQKKPFVFQKKRNF